MLLAGAFEDHIVDAGISQQLSEQKPGRPRTDDHDLRPQNFLPSIPVACSCRGALLAMDNDFKKLDYPIIMRIDCR
jgi:hypothetical protein